MSQTLEALVVELRADVKGLQTSLQTAAGDVQRFSNSATRSVDGFQASILRARSAVLTLGAAWAAFRLGKSIVDAGMQMQSLQNRMLAATGDARVAAEAMQFVRDQSERLGQDVRATADGFASFSAAALRAGLTMKQTKDIFTGVSEAAAALHLSSERVELVFTALSQMASKGKVSMEELSQQLGDSLPGALAIFAKAMGVSTAEFTKMISEGRVLVPDLIKLGDELHNQFGQRATQAAESAQAAFARLGNSLFELQVKLANSGILDVVTDGVRDLTSALNDPATVEGLVKFAEALAVIARIALEVASGIGAALYKIGEFETKALAMVGLGAGAQPKQQPRISIPVTPTRTNDDYTLGKISKPVASDSEKKARGAAIKKADSLREQLASQAQALKYQFSSPEQQATMDVEKQQETLRKALEAKAITEQEYRDLSLEAEVDYQEKLAEIRDKAREDDQSALESFLGARIKSEDEVRNQSLADQAKNFRDTISQAAQHNRAFFVLEKAAAIARALISARESVVSAYAFGSRIGGPPLGAVFAGVAAAAQAANIAAIASTSFGGGGSAVGSSGSSAATGGEDTGASGNTSSGQGKSVYITLNGDDAAFYSKNNVRKLIETINDAVSDGSQLKVSVS